MTAPGNGFGILLLGSESGFCFHALKGLLEPALPVAGVVIAAGTRSSTKSPITGRSIPLAQPGSVADLAAGNGIPVIQCSSTREDWAFELALELGPDVLLLACLPERLDLRWSGVPKYGCFNLHPSLLPAYRGPAPLFWQMRDGLSRTGVTVHRVEPEIDAGAILAQETLPVGATDTLATLNAALATAGVRLFARSLCALTSGKASLAPQDNGPASRQPWPTQEDFALNPAWPASRAFRFVQATAALGHPYRMKTESGLLLIDRLIEFDDTATMAVDFEWKQGALSIRFSPGVLTATGRLEREG